MTEGVGVVRSVPPPVVGLFAQLALLAGLATGVGLGIAGWVAGTAYALAGWWLLTRGLRSPMAGRWGPADTVTLVRAVLTGGVTALVAESLTGSAPVAVLVALAGAALVLDGVDGQVARRTGTASRFGARFDMETDSVLVLVLAVFVAATTSWWLLVIGGFRYAFGVAAWAAPWLRAPLPPRLSRKAVAVLQGVALVVASAGVAPVGAVQAGLLVVLSLLVWSFTRDVRALWRLRRPGRQDTVDVTRVGLMGQRGQVLRQFFLGDPAVEGQPVSLAQCYIEPVRAQ